MNRYVILSLAVASCTLSSTASPSICIPSSSPTASGKWVKVEVEESGMYEISFAKLSELGFSDPKTVAVYGAGGRMLPENFTESNGVPTASGGLDKVPVMMCADKLVFYGMGIEDVAYVKNSSYELGCTFERKSFNIYSRKGYYFLTDADAPEEIALYPLPAAVSQTPATCMDYRYLEQDLQYNPTYSGTMFWGETITYPEIKKTYELHMPGALRNSPVSAQCLMQFNDYTLNRPLTFGFEENSSYIKVNNYSSPVYSYIPVPYANGNLVHPGEKGTFSVEFNLRNNGGKGFLDYWVFAYEKSLPTLETERQARVQLHDIKLGEGIELPDVRDNVIAWDVTNPQCPRQLQRNERRNYSFTASKANPSLIFFDPTQKMLDVANPVEMPNQDLHSRAAQGADLLIITTETMIEYAEQLADLHRHHDGIEVLVAKVEEIYNEYSSGRPDPMAYKWLAKSLYLNSSRPLRNILLFGDFTSDIRGMNVEKSRPQDYIIAYQQKAVNRSTGAPNSNDFIAVMSDYISGNLQAESLAVGIGVIPVRNIPQAKNYVRKVERYLDETDFAFSINKMMWMSCPGDDHMHEISAVDTQDAFNSYSGNSMVITPIVVNAYPDVDQARDQYFASFAGGHVFNYYFGHGDPTGFAITSNLLMPVHLMQLNNRMLPFTAFAGCNIANFDRGESGIGEKMVIDMVDGSIGALIATRETYNNENCRFLNTFFRAMMLESDDPESPRRDSMSTIGEIYARYKSALNYSNEFSYHLMCDPALVIPMPSLDVRLESETVGLTGESCLVKGYVATHGGEKVTDFNGTVVVRLMSPPYRHTSGDYVIAESNSFSYERNDEMLQLVSGEVKNGEFALSLPVPATLSRMGNASLAIGAYDPAARRAAAARPSFSVNIGGSEPDEDLTPPSISNVEYDTENNFLRFDLCDNQGLNHSIDPFRPAIEVRIDASPLSPHSLLPTAADSEGRFASYQIALPRLYDGQHSAIITAYDLAGNRSRLETVFSTRQLLPVLTLEVEGRLDSANAVLKCPGVPEDAVLVVADSRNKTVARFPWTGATFTWNYRDQSGNPLPAGIYRLTVTSPEGFSNGVDIPVIQ